MDISNFKLLTENKLNKPCEVCQIPWGRDKRSGIVMPQCDCYSKPREQDKVTIEENLKGQLLKSGLIADMVDCKFETYPGDKVILERVKEFISQDKPRTVIFGGITGRGKTGLAASCLRYWVQNNLGTLKYELAYKLIGAGTMTDTRQKTLEKFLKYDLLVIDEIGVQTKTEAARDFLGSLLSERHGNLKTTILITNLDGKKFTEIVGERVMERIKYQGEIIAFKHDKNLRIKK